MRRILAISKNTYLEAVRSNILYSVLFFAALIIAISAVFGSVSIGEQYLVVKSFGYTIISLSAVICTILSGISLFQKEITQKTIYNILSKPVSRTEFLLGKLLGLVLTTWTLSAIMILCLLLFVMPLEGRFDFIGFQALIVICLEVIIVSCLTLFFSSLAVTPVLPGIFTLSSYIAGKSIFYLNYFIVDEKCQDCESLPSLVTFFIRLLSWVLPDLHALTPYDRLLYQVSLSIYEISLLVIYTLFYSLILFLLSNIIFSKREL
ncbi:MAG TPA: ABC transporter permease [Oligoflexia bacterium]|nr:ABC transporter permease [Oligoflexia bacterium]HMP48437.1 ABC transporter permease [Oligoflexia bacterium]